jgi:transposase
MLRPSFVPPRPIRQLRHLTRHRADLVAARTAEKQRVEQLLEDAQIKLSVVASDIFGVSGRAMLASLLAGERDPKVLAQLARARSRAKLSLLAEAFTGFFTDQQAFLLAKMLARVDALDADLAEARRQARRADRPPRRGGRAAGRDPRARPDRCAAAHRRARDGHDPVPDRRAPGVMGQICPRRQGVRRQAQGQRIDRARQPLPGSGAR